MNVFRCFTEKREGFSSASDIVLNELRNFLGVSSLESVRILYRYDVEGISQDLYRDASDIVFSQPQTDIFYNETPPDFGNGCRTLIVEAQPGQYDQRAEGCAHCLRALALSAGGGQSPQANAECGMRDAEMIIAVATAKMYVFYGNISDSDMNNIRRYLINPLGYREAAYEKPETLIHAYPAPDPVGIVNGFIAADDDALDGYTGIFSLAMDFSDLQLTRDYFRDTEKRDPTVTELKLIDTYWSDHCRHTTFNTHITDISIDDPHVKTAYDAYLKARSEVYGDAAGDRPQTLMDIATIAAKLLRKRGLLENLDISEEVNACSIRIEAEVNGSAEDWLLMFKNETHNHPTEVEPFGGAATCVGGAIRDVLAGRAYVYQAMRITGAGDPRAAIGDTLPGKLPQRQITTTAAEGYSSYGNQIGVASGIVHEIYHPGYAAKRMELGAVVGAVRAGSVVRETPAPGDKVILLGGRTGRDGIGGATGSSKPQTEGALVTMAAEVQKGNPMEERGIQRLFLDPEVTKMIKRCNDFGAGGVSVSVGELADGLDIDLSCVRLKYDGLDGTEIALSESQERMAVVVAPANADAFIKKAAGENLEAYVIADVTEQPRLIMRHNGTVIVDIAREFLSTNGTVKHAAVRVDGAKGCGDANARCAIYNVQIGDAEAQTPGDKLRALVGDLRFCSQRGLYQMFDGTVGSASILMKNGGKTRSAPVQAMAAQLPVLEGETTTCSVMAFGFDPYLSSISPFEGAKTAVITSTAKLVASGCDPDRIYLTFQEYFERLQKDPLRWGKPFSALLGALEAQLGLELAAVGGKDSMSGSFGDIDVPPTLVSFAIAPNESANVISPEFKNAGSDVVIFNPGGDLAAMKQTWREIRALIEDNAIVSAWALTEGGAAEGIFKMAAGNNIGFEYSSDRGPESLFEYIPGAIIAEVTRPVRQAVTIGRTISEPAIILGSEKLELSLLRADWESVLEDIFPTKKRQESGAREVESISFDIRPPVIAGSRFAKPRTAIITFPGTNSEIDTARAVSRAGGAPNIVLVRNLTPAMFLDSIQEAVNAIRESQIVIIPGGSSMSDEPDGSAKLINLFFRAPALADTVHDHLKNRDGLMLGICNGFQALVRLGLVPFGEIVPADAGSPILTSNIISKLQAGYAYTRVASVNSPWMSLCSVGDVHAVAISHGEGRFAASDEIISRLIAGGQIATQYTDIDGRPSMHSSINPSGSDMAVEGVFSPDGRVFGKMGHSERYGRFVSKNIYGEKHQPVFESGVNYFT